MAAKKKPTTGQEIAPLVHLLRHKEIILDSDLAKLYGVDTKRLNETVKRNLDRCRPDFMFQLTEVELEILRSHIATSRTAEPNLIKQSGNSSMHGGRRTLPYAFTEQDRAMLSKRPSLAPRRGGEHRHHASACPASPHSGKGKPMRDDKLVQSILLD